MIPGNIFALATAKPRVFFFRRRVQVLSHRQVVTFNKVNLPIQRCVGVRWQQKNKLPIVFTVNTMDMDKVEAHLERLNDFWGGHVAG